MSYIELLEYLKANGITPSQEEIINNEINIITKNNEEIIDINDIKDLYEKLYDKSDLEVLQNVLSPERDALMSIKTLDELLEQDNQRVKDGFPRRIRLGKLVKPIKGSKSKVVVVPSTTETKFYHDNSVTEDGEGGGTGGSGEGEEGEVIGEQKADPQQGEGEGQGAGEGGGESHDESSEAFDLGKVLTEKFKLPNIKDKGKKLSMVKFKYDLTDRNRGFGQLLDKKETLKKIISTNILLGNIDPAKGFSPDDLILNPKDKIYRILSKEKDYETQAVVFFLRDYSGSMQGKPTEVITTQHLFIYSWLMYQYQGNVETRFILHDTEAKEVEDFYTYFKLQVAGGTNVFPAFTLVNKIVEEEQLAKDYNIYVFYGTDGDDWDSAGKKMLPQLDKMLQYVNRIGITVAKNSWTGDRQTTVEKYLESAKVLKEKSELIKLDAFSASTSDENRIIESIKKIVE